MKIELKDTQHFLEKIYKNPNSNLTHINLTLPFESLPVLAKILGKFLYPGDWLFLEGDLGAGKTALAKEISLFYGVVNFFTSPTFSILNSENIKNHDTLHKILHLDLYRIKSGKDLCFIGLEHEFNLKNTLVLIEWPDVIEYEDWDYFFKMTKCARPARILNIKIVCNNDVREYELSFINLIN